MNINKQILITVKKIKILIFLSVIGVLNSFAQTDKSPSIFKSGPSYLKGTAIISGATFSPLQSGRIASHLIERTTSAKLKLKLDLGEDYVATGDVAANHYKVTLELIYNFNNSTINSTKTLTITEKNPEQLIIVDFLAHVNSGDLNSNINVSIGSITINDGSSNLIALNPTSFIYKNIQNNLRVSAEIQREYVIDIRENNSSQSLVGPISIRDVQITNKRVKFSWGTYIGTQPVYDFPNYELQILRLYNTDLNNTTDQKHIKTIIDWSQALKVETQSYKTFIDLTMMEGTGFYVWRIRPIGTYNEGGIANSDNYGVWSSSLETGDEIEIDESVIASDYKYFYFTDLEENLNWIYSRVFTEGNDEEKGVRTSEGMTYADPLNRVRQSQAYNSEDNKTIVTQTISDYSGRAALSTLPVPVDPAPGITGLDGYKVKFVQNENGNLYTALDYDNDKVISPDIKSTVDAPHTIKDNGTNFSYYNGSQIDGVGDAEGYSFTRTKFKTDGTSRASEVSGIGSTFALGTNRTSRVLFSSASDEELIRVFGAEAPLAESVIKTITIDPNGSASVSYTSKEGKTIATALISNSTDNLVALNNKDNSFIVKNSTDQNILHDQVYTSSKRIALWQEKDVELDYQVDQNGSSCLDCEFKVVFYLIDLEKDITYRSDADGFSLAPQINKNLFVPFTVQTGKLDFPSNWNWVLENNSASGNFTMNNTTARPSSYNKFHLNAGEYLLVKKVYSSKLPNAIEDDNDKLSDGVQAVMDAVSQKMLAIKNSADLTNFEIFMNTLTVLFSQDRIASSPEICSLLGIPSTVLPSNFNLRYEPSIDGISPGQIKFSTAAEVGCATCDPKSVPIPRPDKCLACDAVLGEATLDPSFIGIETIRKSATPDELKIGGSAWNKINSIVKIGVVDDEEGDGFLEYLHQNKLYKASPSPSALLSKIAPGFTEESLAYMITNMLVSKYYTGQSKEGPNNVWYPAKEDATGALQFLNPDNSLTPTVITGITKSINEIENLGNFPFNYPSCKSLYNCWVSSVNTLGIFEFEGATNPMDEYNDRSDDKSSEDEQDDKSNQDDAEDKGAFQGLMDWVISQKMRKFNNSDEGNFSPSKLNSFVDLPATFFSCIGYQFAEILDEESLSTSNHTDDYNNSFNIPTNPYAGSVTKHTIANGFDMFGTNIPVMFEEGALLTPLKLKCTDCNNNESPVDQLYYSYITKPEWMFKYFVYNSSEKFNSSNGAELLDNNIYIPSQPDVEILTCYNNPYANKDQYYPNYEQCHKACNYYHKNWSAGQRYNFYTLIKATPICDKINVCPEDPHTPVVIECSSAADLKAKANAKINEAKKACTDRKGEFKQIIMAELLQSCFTIVECVTGDAPDDVISMPQIDQMVTSVSDACLSKVQVIYNKLNDANTQSDYWKSTFVNNSNKQVDSGEYPYCEKLGCVTVNPKGSDATLFTPTEYIKEILFVPCDQQVLDEVINWNFDIEIPQAIPNCPTETLKDWKKTPLATTPSCTGTHIAPSGSTFTDETTIGTKIIK